MSWNKSISYTVHFPFPSAYTTNAVSKFQNTTSLCYFSLWFQRDAIKHIFALCTKIN